MGDEPLHIANIGALELHTELGVKRRVVGWILFCCQNTAL